MSQGSGGWFFGGVDLFEVFIGVFVEGFDAAFAAEADELTLVEGVDGFACTTDFVARNGAGGEGVSFGEFGCFSFFFWGFDDLGLLRSGRFAFLGIPERKEGKEEGGKKDEEFCFHEPILDEKSSEARERFDFWKGWSTF